MPEISFIIPLYKNTIEEIDKCLKSIENQNIMNFEIIVINDGSDDENIDRYFENLSKNIKYYYQKNSGSAVARNKGLEKATGKYIMFVDADDELAHGFYENFNQIKNRNFDVMIFDYSCWDTVSETINSLNCEKNLINSKEKIFSNIMFNCDEYNNFLFGSIWSKCFLREFIISNNIRFKDRLRKAQDRMFMLEIFNIAHKVFYFPLHCYRYRINNQSICHKMNFKMIDYYYELYREMVEFCKRNKISENSMKYLEYGIVTEFLPLTIFHIDNKMGYFKKKKLYKDILKKFDFLKKIKKLSINDFKTLTRKIKYVLYRLNMFFIINLYFKIKLTMVKRKSFNT